jgi:hypothetical protein
MEYNLTKRQYQIVNDFVKSFLPENNRLIQNPLIELTYITKVLTSIFDEYFDFNVSVEDVFGIFEEYGYALSVVEPRHASQTGSPYVRTNSDNIYINISPFIIKELEMINIYNNDKDAIIKTLQLQNILLKLKTFEAAYS